MSSAKEQLCAIGQRFVDEQARFAKFGKALAALNLPNHVPSLTLLGRCSADLITFGFVDRQFRLRALPGLVRLEMSAFGSSESFDAMSDIEFGEDGASTDRSVCGPGKRLDTDAEELFFGMLRYALTATWE